MGKPKRADKPASGLIVNRRDRCQTPDYALDPLAPYLKREWLLWEPARGEGYLEHAIKANGLTVVSGDLLTGQNYFLDESIPPMWDAQVTNPPFSLKYKWLARAYKLGKPFALIMPIDVFGSKTAQALFETYGVEVILFNKRIDYGMPSIGFEGSSSQFASAWFTWGLGIGRQLTFSKISKRKQRTMTAIADDKQLSSQQAMLFSVDMFGEQSAARSEYPCYNRGNILSKTAHRLERDTPSLATTSQEDAHG